ncbi:MAG TPA: cysteine rich repeat-containing protein [Rhizobacter sp.]|nr:cysteine rich repeat-containing protein [Rhizobacter sp.]
MNSQRFLAGLSLLGFAAMSPAFAADTMVNPPPMKPLEQACHQDVQTLCPGIKPGENRILQCMKKYPSQISDGCKVAMKEAQAKQKKSKAASGPHPAVPG